MPSIYDIKPAFQDQLRPIVHVLANLGITANQITIIAVIFSLVMGGSILCWPDSPWPLLFLPFVLILRMGLNAIDGMLAREQNMKTNLGALLNEIGDVISDSAMYLPFALIASVSAPLVIIIVVLSAISEMTGIVAIQIAGVRRYDGPMGKSDRAFMFGLLALILGFGFEDSFWLNSFLVIVVLLLVITIYNRAHKALKDADNEK